MSEKPLPRLIRHTKESYGESFQGRSVRAGLQALRGVGGEDQRPPGVGEQLPAHGQRLPRDVVRVARARGGPRGTGRSSCLSRECSFTLTWHRIITSYRDLNSVKFKVIHELEQQMPDGAL